MRVRKFAVFCLGLLALLFLTVWTGHIAVILGAVIGIIATILFMA